MQASTIFGRMAKVLTKGLLFEFVVVLETLAAGVLTMPPTALAIFLVSTTWALPFFSVTTRRVALVDGDHDTSMVEPLLPLSPVSAIFPTGFAEDDERRSHSRTVESAPDVVARRASWVE